MQLRFYINGATTPSTPESLGIATATLSLLSLAADQLRLSTTRALGQAPLAYGDTVRLTRRLATGEETLFAGKVASVRAAADAIHHTHDILVLGPWKDLEQIVYKQPATLYDATSGATIRDYASRVILSGGGATVAQALADVVAYAAANGAPLAATPECSAIAMVLPRDEQEGLTCAGAIRRLLRFMPDATATFDYAQTPPKLVFRRATQTLSLAGCRAAAVNLAALRDRAIDRVEIEIYRTHDIDGTSRVPLERLRYPADPTAWAEGASACNTLSVPMEMDGRSVAYEKARIETEKLPENLGINLFTAEKLWLQRHIEDLTDNIFTWPDDVEVTYKTRRFLRVNDAGEAVYEEKEGAAALVQFPRMALSAIPHWVDTSAEATVTVRFPRKAESRTIGGVSYDIGETEDEIHTLTFTACSKESGNYRRVAEAVSAEVCPASLPEQLWASWHNVFMEGALTLWVQGDEPLPKVGDAVTGYPGEEAGTLALVQGLTLGDGGQLELTLGPPEHLSPYDLVELLRGFRSRRPAVHADSQESGIDPSGVDTGAATAKKSSGHSAALQTKVQVYGAADKSKRVSIDPDSMGANAEASLREVTLLAYNAESKKLQPIKAHILSTAPTNDGEEVEVGGGALPAKEFLIKSPAAALDILPGSGEGSSATPPKLRLTLPIFNPNSPDTATTLTLEADASALKGEDGEDGEGGTLPEGQTLTVVTGVVYDTTTHKLQAKTRTITVYGTVGAEQIVDITTAVAHSTQH